MQQETFNNLLLELEKLPKDEMSREYELFLTNLIMKQEYADIISFIEHSLDDISDETKSYALFVMCTIYYRRVKEHNRQEHLISLYTDLFKHHKSFEHFRILSFVDVGYIANWRELLKDAKNNAIRINSAGAWHMFAEHVAMTLEYEEHDATNAEYDMWIKEGLKAIEMALMLQSDYAKFYCTKGRIYALLKDFKEAERCIRFAIEKEDHSKKDYSIRIGNYQYHLLKVQARGDRVAFTDRLDLYKQEVEETITTVSEKSDMIDKSLMRNLEYLGVFSGIISFTMGTINLAGALAEKSFMGAAGLIVVLFAALVGVFMMFDLIIHGYRKENNKMYIIVLFVVILALSGGLYLCSMI